jgi:hypothetical protein
MKSYDVKMFPFWFQWIVVREKKHRHKLEPNGKSDSRPLIIHPSWCTSCDIWVWVCQPNGKKCFLVPLATIHSSWCICGSCVRCGPNGKVFSVYKPSIQTIHPNHPSFTHCSCGSCFTLKYITQFLVVGVNPMEKCFVSTHHPSLMDFWLFVYVILWP